MAYMVIQIQVPAASIQTFNDKITDATKPHEGVTQLSILLDTINGGQAAGEVDVYVSNVAQSITTGGGGISAFYNLL